MFRIIVEGDYACFTRPDSKVERVSYPVPTPSALEGLIKAVYWKPAIRYVIDKIVVFNPIVNASIRRNERKDKISFQAVKNQMNGQDVDCRNFHSTSNTNQRTTICLKNVKYGIEFHFEMTGYSSEKEDESEAKHASILERRLKNGQFFKTPCLGCREFAVNSITLVEGDFDLSQVDKSLQGEQELGTMLYGLKFKDNEKKQRESWSKSNCTDNADPVFYQPVMKNGVIDVASAWEVRKT